MVVVVVAAAVGVVGVVVVGVGVGVVVSVAVVVCVCVGGGGAGGRWYWWRCRVFPHACCGPDGVCVHVYARACVAAEYFLRAHGDWLQLRRDVAVPTLLSADVVVSMQVRRGTE